MKKNQTLLTVEANGYTVENVKLFNGLYRVHVYKGGTIYRVFKSGSLIGNQNNLKKAADVVGLTKLRGVEN